MTGRGGRSREVVHDFVDGVGVELIKELDVVVVVHDNDYVRPGTMMGEVV